MIERGSIFWADPGPASGSRPAKRRPVLVVSSDAYNASRLRTVLAAVITSSTALAAMPGNAFLPAASTGLPRDSVVNVTALVTLDKRAISATRSGRCWPGSWTTSIVGCAVSWVFDS